MEGVDKSQEQLQGKITGFKKIDKFITSLEDRGEWKLFVFSISHRDPVDSMLCQIKRKLKSSGIILDGGNKYYYYIERHQQELNPFRVS